LSTATQPALEANSRYLQGFENVWDIVPEEKAKEHFQLLKRVRYEVESDALTWDRVATELRGQKRAMAVVNTDKTRRSYTRPWATVHCISALPCVRPIVLRSSTRRYRDSDTQGCRPRVDGARLRPCQPQATPVQRAARAGCVACTRGGGMILRRLAEYADRLDLTPEMYEEAGVAWIIELTADGELEGFVPLEDVRLTVPRFRKESEPRVLSDQANHVLNLERGRKHSAFVELARRCYEETEDERILAVVKFLEDLGQVEVPKN
jgi:hypothetical protein